MRNLRKKRVFGILLVLILISLAIFVPKTEISFLGTTEPAVESPAEIIPKETTDSGIEVYFCPREDCEQELFKLLDSANVSIHCATFELNLPRVVSLLDNKSEDIDVKIVVDDAYYDGLENLSWVRHDGKQGLMHNKFCIVDGKEIYTGSFNPTKNCAYKNNNNMLVIESRYLSQNYEEEFEELWAGKFGKGDRVAFPKIVYNNMTIQNYFCPEDNCRERVRAEIMRANKSIYFLAFSFTDDYIGQDLVLRYNEGIDVRGVFEKTKISDYSEYHLLEYQGIDVRLDKNKYNMHNKVFIIDNRTVITGSFNPSGNANYDNDENILIIEDEGIAKEYLEEFWRVWNQ